MPPKHKLPQKTLSVSSFSLEQLIDLALGGPEPGIVNFNLLHYVLHIIAKELKLNNVRVDFIGTESVKIKKLYDAVKTSDQGMNVTDLITIRHESTATEPEKPIPKKSVEETEDNKEKYEKERSEKRSTDSGSKKKKKGKKEKEEKDVEEKAGKPEPQHVPHPSEPRRSESRPRPARSKSDTKKSHIVEISEVRDVTSPAPSFSIYVNPDDYNKLVDEIQTLRDDLTDVMAITSGAQAVLGDHTEVLREGGNVVELFTALNIIKRMEAAESQLYTLADLWEKFAKEFNDEDLCALTGMTRGELLKHVFAHLTDLEANFNKMFGNLGKNPKEVEDTVNQLEIRVNFLTQQLNHLDTIYNNQLASIIAELGEKKKTQVSQEMLCLLRDRLGRAEQETKLLSEKLTKLSQEKEGRQDCINAMVEQIEMLNITKANLEDMEIALDGKVDICLLTKKVSHDTFEHTADDLSKGIEQALQKLSTQEELWSEALNEIQRLVGTKLDKQDISPLKDFINRKLTILHEKFKTLDTYKKEKEGAATKYLKNVNCIACDADIVMKKREEQPALPKGTALPPMQSMAPYLAYELDQIRKQQKCSLPLSKNMNYFQSAIDDAAAQKGNHHVCNRYCGGNHTTTTPQQRVTRVGHFLENWSPNIQSVTPNALRGTDGQVYRGEDTAKHPKSFSARASQQPSLMVEGDILTERSSARMGPKDGAGDGSAE